MHNYCMTRAVCDIMDLSLCRLGGMSQYVQYKLFFARVKTFSTNFEGRQGTRAQALLRLDPTLI